MERIVTSMAVISLHFKAGKYFGFEAKISNTNYVSRNLNGL